MHIHQKVNLCSKGLRLLVALGSLVVSQVISGPLSAMIVVVIPGFEGSVTIGNLYFPNAFVADSFSFGVEREMKESGVSSGTEDINIGVGELQECTISKSMDAASTMLAQFAINGNSAGVAEIHFIAYTGLSAPVPYVYLKYKLDRCFIKSWSVSGDADDRPTEEVAFYYNKIAFVYRSTVDGINFLTSDPAGWDRTTDTPWTDVSFDVAGPQ